MTIFEPTKLHTYFLMNTIEQNTGVSYKAGFFMLIVFAAGGMFLSSLLSIAIIMLMTGQGASSMPDIIVDPKYYRVMQVVQSVSAIVMMFIPTLFTASRLSKKPLSLTGFRGAVSIKQFWIVLLITFCALLLSGALGYVSYQIPFPKDWKILFDRMENDYMKQAINLIKLDNGVELFISLSVLAFLPAVCEETFFRGGLQNYLFRSSGKMWLSIIIVSLIFSAIHFSMYGFLSRLALGIILGLVFHYTKILWLSILLHFINNATAVLAIYIQKSNGKSIAELMSDKDGSYWGLIAIPVIIILFAILKKESENNFNTDGI